jgi:hypothetical protein
MGAFQNDDRLLLENVERVREKRSRDGLDGMVGGLSAVILNTEPEAFSSAVSELLRYTGLDLA